MFRIVRGFFWSYGNGIVSVIIPACRLNVATVPAVDRNYYNWSVRTLTLFLQTGNFFGPVE
jgi:hypothetical protein